MTKAEHSVSSKRDIKGHKENRNSWWFKQVIFLKQKLGSFLSPNKTCDYLADNGLEIWKVKTGLKGDRVQPRFMLLFCSTAKQHIQNLKLNERVPRGLNLALIEAVTFELYFNSMDEVEKVFPHLYT